jgi:hypothetical protein
MRFLKAPTSDKSAQKANERQTVWHYDQEALLWQDEQKPLLKKSADSIRPRRQKYHNKQYDDHAQRFVFDFDEELASLRAQNDVRVSTYTAEIHTATAMPIIIPKRPLFVQGARQHSNASGKSKSREKIDSVPPTKDLPIAFEMRQDAFQPFMREYAMNADYLSQRALTPDQSQKFRHAQQSRYPGSSAYAGSLVPQLGKTGCKNALKVQKSAYTNAPIESSEISTISVREEMLIDSARGSAGSSCSAAPTKAIEYTGKRYQSEIKNHGPLLKPSGAVQSWPPKSKRAKALGRLLGAG